jgi:LysM repeat protein/DNA-directed RNA polymerase specialized sigma24 family protein
MTTFLGLNELNEELSPDLEWMLQNGQVSDEVLITTLLKEYSRDLTRLAISLLKDKNEAYEAVRRVISLITLNRYQYSSRTSVKAWIYKWLLRFSQKKIFFWNKITRRVFRSHRINQTTRTVLTSPTHSKSYIWKMLGLLKESKALLLTLYYGHDLSIHELSFVLNKTPHQIQAELEKTRDILQAHLKTCLEVAFLPKGLPDLEALLRQELQSEGQNLDLSEAEITSWQLTIQNHVIREFKNRRISVQAKETVLVGMIAALIFTMVWLVNRSLPAGDISKIPTIRPQEPATTPQFYYYTVKAGDDFQMIAQKAGVTVDSILTINQLSRYGQLSPGQLLKLPTGRSENWLVTPMPFARFSTPAPLTGQPTIDEILQRFNENMSLWHTVWANLLVIQYGLPGYLGPPQSVTRKQVWIDLPSHIRVNYGPMGEEPSISYSIIAGHLYGHNYLNDQVIENLTSELILDLDLQKLFLPNDTLLQNGYFKLVGIENVIDRIAWVLDWYNTSGIRIYRYWVDAEYGALLGIREYSGLNGEIALEDISVTSIAFDAENFPATIFNPFLNNSDHFARDISGAIELSKTFSAMSSFTGITGHEPLSNLPIPPNFDPSRSHLTFQEIHSSGGDNLGMALYADGYYLGELPLGNASMLTCKRSPDGSRIAYSTVLNNSGNQKSELFWADLSSVNTNYPIFDQGRVSGDFAFSPDGRQLAFFGCKSDSSSCGVYILDVTTNKVRQLIPLMFADYFLWRPDSQFLAIVVDSNGLHDWKYWVVQIDHGDIIYEGKFDWNSLRAAADSPTNNWGVFYLSQPLGLEGCSDPPIK